MAMLRRTDKTPFSDLAASCWRRGGDGWEEVGRLEREEPESLPAVIRALTTSAPDGALSYIGVQILEDLAQLATDSGIADTAMDVLIAAELTPAETFEIFSGPYPEFLDGWGVRELFASTFSAAQLDALLDWGSRSGRRLLLDGTGCRLADVSTWFNS